MIVELDGKTYELTDWMLSRIAADRSRAGSFRRGGNAPAYVRVISALHKEIAAELKTDRSTTRLILLAVPSS